ncbi:MAG: MoaD/ThiS family protein [Deltaproteobacteria bacterium]|nr:MoaD/ThiS family protein [Deltaproteobacteria bacterium]
MQIELKLFMRFKQYLPAGGENGIAQHEIADESTFKDLLDNIGMPVEEDKIIVINGISHKQGEEANVLQLNDGDTVAIFPPIAGG